MRPRLECLARALSIQCNFSRLPLRNVAQSVALQAAQRKRSDAVATVGPISDTPSGRTGSNPDPHPVAAATLGRELLELLRERLRDDFELYARHCNGCSPSCQCCHSLGGAVGRLDLHTAAPAAPAQRQLTHTRCG
jgi:hypothetical protein